ncbi:MAG: tetraacyldisaccharide 4'-kinase [Rhizobiaceae bacterium]|nr:tetraacyldisaccharide 4'-kinase [Rhizobiaceae bacterium]
MSSAPPFWWERPGWQAVILWPASKLYGWISARRMRRALRTPVDAPVICVGNFTVGGTGKTPTVIALAGAAVERGMKPGIVSRGHGGSTTRARLVDATNDTATLVGDEPLLLARHASVAVSRNRVEGAALLLKEGCNLILMDDGFQSAHLEMDHAVLAIDAGTGVGNGHIIPGGPLRAPLVEQLRYADSVLRIGEGKAADEIVRMAARAGLPVYDARNEPVDPLAVAGKRVLAFAGIGNPQRFYDALSVAGAHVVETRSFDDHHPFKLGELQQLMSDAKRQDLQLVTTEKDVARLHGGIKPDGFLEKLLVFAVATQFDPPDTAERIIEDAVAAWRKRRFSA